MMYRSSLLLLFTFISTHIFAQLYCPPIQGKRSEGRFHIAVGVGPTLLYGDLGSPETTGFAGYLAGDYTVIRGIDVGIEGQLGSLQAVGEDISDNREVTNNFKGLGVMVKVFPFRLLTEKKFNRMSFADNLKESLYVGVGVLGIVNSYDSIYHERANSITLPTLNIGFAIPVNQLSTSTGRYWSVILNGQFNFANNDLLDGYDVGTKNDFYSFYTLGVRYSF